jgi:hypothetical protein
MSRCALEICLEKAAGSTGRLREPIEVVMQQLINHIAPHIASCTDPG